MIALQRILVPHDFSETSEAAVRYAVALARNFGARIHLLHVGDQARQISRRSFRSASKARSRTRSASGC